MYTNRKTAYELRFKTYYYPFSFDAPEAIKTRVEIYRSENFPDGTFIHIEIEDFNYILEEEKLDDFKQRKRDEHEDSY